MKKSSPLTLRIVTYFITDLPQFSSLAPCARSGLSSGVFANTYSLCPDGPQALASCACIKDGMSGYVSGAVTSSVKYECTSKAADISSALAVSCPPWMTFQAPKLTVRRCGTCTAALPGARQSLLVLPFQVGRYLDQ